MQILRNSWRFLNFSTFQPESWTVGPSSKFWRSFESKVWTVANCPIVYFKVLKCLKPPEMGGIRYQPSSKYGLQWSVMKRVSNQPNKEGSWRNFLSSFGKSALQINFLIKLDQSLFRPSWLRSKVILNDAGNSIFSYLTVIQIMTVINISEY